jgi:hypothetical protein
MQETRRILLYGNSLILAPIGARLRSVSQFEVTTLAPMQLEPQQVDNVKPDLVLFDLEGPHTEAVFSLLKSDPALVLIGISPDINLVKVWHSQQIQDISMQDLIELIKSTEKTFLPSKVLTLHRP